MNSCYPKVTARLAQIGLQIADKHDTNIKNLARPGKGEKLGRSNVLGIAQPKSAQPSLIV